MITLKKKKGARKTPLGRRQGGGRAVALLWAKRAGIWGGGALLMAWLGAWVVLSDTPRKLSDWSWNKTLEITSDAGFSVKNILVDGRHYTDPALLHGIINLQAGDPILAFNPDEARAMIEKISWVKTAEVQRRLPDTIFIEITERRPLALWQRDQKLAVIDSEGEVLTGHELERFADLLIVTGDEAARAAPELITLLQAEPELQQRAEAASRVSGRRWNLKLKNGVVVKLPEHDMGLALRRLAASQTEDGLLDKDITQIDVRDPARIVIRTRPGEVQTYNAFVRPGNAI